MSYGTLGWLHSFFHRSRVVTLFEDCKVSELFLLDLIKTCYSMSNFYLTNSMVSNAEFTTSIEVLIGLSPRLYKRGQYLHSGKSPHKLVAEVSQLLGYYL